MIESQKAKRKRKNYGRKGDFNDGKTGPRLGRCLGGGRFGGGEGRNGSWRCPKIKRGCIFK